MAQAEKTFDRIIAATATESQIKTVEASRNYIIGPQKSIMNNINNKKGNVLCSAA